MNSETGITHLERRRIEAGVLVPMIQAMQRELGAARANEIARQVIVGLARQDGERWAAQFGTDLAALDGILVDRIEARLGRRELDDLQSVRLERSERSTLASLAAELL